ncbi:hypothetical protein GWK08_11300 [Leptobacterium flavescens]|uniref:Uncharacterized protein n=1 Tax=Leptobacterium flavescens TaxID=472055 RepID=A0A6P0UQD0_9FLAO|nr:hypothetical protein [Leptobacterium flavescens]NER14029.1 hypothetical protein [Leptobacterium flavescens]
MTYYHQYLAKFRENYMMYIPLTIILQSCLGSVAAMYILQNNDRPFFLVQLFLCVCVCMFYNAAILAQLKTKIVFNLLLISLFLNTVLIVINYL